MLKLESVMRHRLLVRGTGKTLYLFFCFFYTQNERKDGQNEKQFRKITPKEADFIRISKSNQDYDMFRGYITCCYIFTVRKHA